ncbi:MAG: mshL [Francisellaceae bacterium]|nr:mshL [Francisellaceae bacterium]
MKVKNMRNLIRSGLTVSLIAVMGCQTLPKEKSLSKAQLLLREDLLANRRIEIQNELHQQIPSEVSKAIKLDDPLVGIHKKIPAIQKRFNITAESVPAKSFFIGLAQDTPYNIAVHPKVEGSISLQLKNVTVAEVLETVRSIYGYDFKQNNNQVEVTPAALQTRAFTVNYLDLNRGGQSQTTISSSSLDTAQNSSNSNNNSTNANNSSNNNLANNNSSSGSNADNQGSINSKIITTTNSNFWAELKVTLEAMIGTADGRKVAISPLAGIVVVQAMPNELKKVEEFLKSAELTLNRQVILEAKIIEVTLNDGYQAGINWAALTNRMKATQLGSDIFGPNDIATFVPQNVAANAANAVDITPGKTLLDNVNDLTTPFGGVFTLALNYKSLGTLVELLSSQGNVQVLSSPRVSTTNNQKALIKVGTDQFFVTNVSSSTTTSTGGSTSPSVNVTFNPFFSGIALDVTPHISEDDYVTLHIHPTISDVSTETTTINLGGAVSGNSSSSSNNNSNSSSAQTYPLAKSNVRESDNIVRAKNGQVVVIGGLMQDNTEEVNVGTPFLKDIPLVGNLFKHTKQVSKKSELVILLRPIVVNDGKWSEEIQGTIDRFETLNKGFH